MLYKLQRKSPEFSSNPKQSVHDCAAGIEIDFFFSIFGTSGVG